MLPAYEWDEHGDAARIVVVCFGAEFLAQEALFEARFQIKTENEERRADAGEKRAKHEGSGDECQADAGVDGMAYERVGARLNDAVMFFADNPARPKAPEMKASPPSKAKADEGNPEKAPGGGRSRSPEENVPAAVKSEKKKDPNPSEDIVGKLSF